MKFIGLFFGVVFAAKAVLLFTKLAVPAKAQNTLLEPQLGEWCVRGAISNMLLSAAFFLIYFYALTFMLFLLFASVLSMVFSIIVQVKANIKFFDEPFFRL